MFEPSLAAIELTNPISSEMSVMRTSLWGGLVSALQYNVARQQSRIQLFESGLKYISQANEIKQNNYIAGVVCGVRLPVQWGAQNEMIDFYDA